MAVAGNRGGAGGARNIARAQRPAPGPTPAQLTAARAQARTYASQGKQVEKAARVQKRVAAGARRQARLTAPGRYYGSLGQAVEKQANLHNRANELQRQSGRKTKVVGNTLYQKTGRRLLGALPGYWYPVKESGKPDIERASRDEKIHKAEAAAPVLKVMDQTMRPIHAIAGGARAAVKGQGASQIKKATVRGAELKDRYLFSDVLKEAGVKGAPAAVAGAALDIAADPTTYVSFGAGSVARRAAEKAAADTAKQAAKAGLSEAGAETVAKQAAKRAEAAAPRGKGVAVKFAGKEVPGVRRATAATTRVAKAPVRKVAPAAVRAVPAKARTAVRHVRPMLRPADIGEETHIAARGATRRARAKVQTSEARAFMLARDLKRRLPADQYAAVIDAIERNKLSRLPDELAPHAHNLRSALKGAYREGRRAGAVQGKAATGEFLTSGDVARLRKTVKAEPAAQERRVAQLERKELKARYKAEQAQQAAQAGAKLKTAVTTERARGAAATEQARLTGRARVVTERVRGVEAKRAAVGTERALAGARKARDQARLRLQTELRKPITRRRGVAGLHAKLQHAEERLRTAREGVYPPAPVSAVRPKVAPKPVEAAVPASARAGKAALKYESRAAQTMLAQRRAAAAKTIPERGIAESQTDYVKRLRDYGRQHDLPLLERRATNLLASKPADLAKGYFPRDFEERVTKQLGLKPTDVAAHAGTRAGPGRKVARITPGFARSEQRRLATVNPERTKAEQAAFSTNVPLVTINHLKRMARATSQGEFAKEMAGLGRRVRSADELREGESLYKLGYRGKQFGLHRVQNVPVKPTKGGQYVALPERLVAEMEDAAQRVAAKTPVGMKFDKATGLWKRAATASLSFHVRNLLGDIQQSYLVTPGHQLPRNIGQAGKAVRRASEQGRVLRPSQTDATIKVAGKRMHVDDFLKGARREGVLDAGWIGRELHDLSGEGAEHVRKLGRGGKAGRVGQSLDRWMTNRENLMRLATYKSGLDRGLSERAAAEQANRIHIDYGELSQFERTFARRAMPFYTWTARSLPITGKALVQTPGKFANIEKLREETGKAFTGEDELKQRGRMTPAIARQLPFVIKVGGQPVALSASLPATLLNELPTGVTPKAFGEYLDELGRFASGMVSPAIRAPAELRTGINLVTRREIENKDRPLTAAPAWVKALPPRAKRALDVTPKFKDPKTGKTTWGWRGKADWGYDQVMLGLFGQAAQLAGAGRAPAPTETNVTALFGPRADVLGPAQTKHAAELRIYNQLDRLNRRLGILNQQGINAQSPTPEYRRLRDQVNKLQSQVRPRKKKSGSSLFDTAPSSKGGSLFDTPASSGGKSLFD